MKRKLTAGRKAAFIEELQRHGVFAEAARVASPHAKDRHGASATFRDETKRDPEFASAVIAAQEEADAKLLTEARRRAVDGVERGIFQKGGRVIDHNGEPATEKQYSDRLMELLLKSRFPQDFIERKAVEHRQATSGWQITAADLQALTDAQVDQLTAIMAAVMTARGEMEPDRALDDSRSKTIEADFEDVSEENLEDAVPW